MKRTYFLIRPAVCLGLAALSIGLSGCSRSSSAAVDGVVQLDGQPLHSGSVILYCADGQIVVGLIGPDGSYNIPNVPRGKVRATVRSHTQLPGAFHIKSNLPKSIDAPTPPSSMNSGHGSIQAVPERYGVPEESGLSVAVDQQHVRFDIALTR